MLGVPTCPLCRGLGYVWNFAGTITHDCDCVRAVIQATEEADQPAAAMPDPTTPGDDAICT